ncbi:MAG: aliphatic sulfonate ABC transporter substrate-binding protein [Chloroflexales bacterium]|nr:aliphatic sulfonate ABC transporter substrate-binding protein [Chloroflexales bacterium]
MKRFFQLFAVLLLVTLLGTACGSAQPETPPADTPTTDTAPADTPTTDTAPADTPTTDDASTDTPESSPVADTPTTDTDMAAPDQVTIGIQTSTSTDIIAKNQGLAEEALGIPVEWVEFPSGNDAILGLGSGSVDMALVGSAPTASGLSTGVDGEVAWIFGLLGEGEALVAQGDSGIASLEDLSGKTVAVPFGSTTHYNMLQALGLANLTLDDVELLDMDPTQMVAAFERGDIDAGWIWYPALDSMYDAGGVLVSDAGAMAEAGFPTSDVLVVSREFGATYPDIVARYVGALNKAVAFAEADLDAAAQVMVDEFGLELEDARISLEVLNRLDADTHLEATYFGTSDTPGAFADSIYSQAQFLTDQGLIAAAEDQDFYQERVNPSYIEMAIEKGYHE